MSKRWPTTPRPFASIPATRPIWVSRGNEWRKDHKLELAIADFTQAIKLNPQFTPAYIARRECTGSKSGALIAPFKNSRTSSGSTPKTPFPTRLWRGCSRPLMRINTATASGRSRKPPGRCELSHWIDPDAYDTLAAACAETGDFSSAVRWQNLALKLVRQRFPSALQKKAVSMGGGRGRGRRTSKTGSRSIRARSRFESDGLALNIGP